MFSGSGKNFLKSEETTPDGVIKVISAGVWSQPVFNGKPALQTVGKDFVQHRYSSCRQSMSKKKSAVELLWEMWDPEISELHPYKD